VVVAASPENLRLRRAIDAFTQAERMVVGDDPTRRATCPA
jgi:UDP-glucose 6-dehydrogenase